MTTAVGKGLSLAVALTACLMPLAEVAAQEQLPASGGAAPTGIAAGTFEQKLSYTLGINIGRDMRENQIPIEPNALAAGIADAVRDAVPQLTDAERQTVMEQLRAMLRARADDKQIAKMSDEAKRVLAMNQKQGAEYLDANAAKPGVVTTATGLQYKVINPGTGASPQASDAVRCNYEGKLISGKVFDASAKHGGPAVFPVGGVIPGWVEALQLMKVGAKWELYIPSNLAYGISGSPPAIGPGETLIFSIELLEIVNPNQRGR